MREFPATGWNTRGAIRGEAVEEWVYRFDGVEELLRGGRRAGSDWIFQYRLYQHVVHFVNLYVVGMSKMEDILVTGPLPLSVLLCEKGSCLRYIWILWVWELSLKHLSTNTSTNTNTNTTTYYYILQYTRQLVVQLGPATRNTTEKPGGLRFWHRLLIVYQISGPVVV